MNNHNEMIKKRDLKKSECDKNKKQLAELISSIYKSYSEIRKSDNNDMHDSASSISINDITTNLTQQEKSLQGLNKEISNKIKDLDAKKDKIYKQRKPMFNKCKTSELQSLLDTNISNLETSTKQIAKHKLTIENINSKVTTLTTNMIKIDELDKILNEECDLPEKLSEMLAYDDEDIDAMSGNLSSKLMELIRANGRTVQTILPTNSDLYKKYDTLAKEYYFVKGLMNYRDENVKTPERITELESQKTKLEKENADIKKEQKEAKTIELQIKQLEFKCNTYEKTIDNIKADMENIEYNAELDMQIDELTETRIEFENQIEVNDIEIANIRILQDSIQKLETQSLKFKSIEMDLEKMESLLAKFITYASDIKNNKIINEEIEELQNNIVQLESEYDSIEKKYNIEQMSLSKYSAQIAQFKKDNKERKDLEKVAEQWEYYKNALKQLPYVLLDKIKPILEKKVNDMLSIATDFNVNFDMADNKIDIYLNRSSYNNKQIIVNNASGFERFMASLAIRMALLELSNLPKINFLAIDEGWSSFDTHNINNVNVIMDYLKTKFDFILTISHLTQIKEHCDKQIFLKRDSAQYSVITYED
jgi:DNA repair exonuclease SbcCD ATPase subunit